MNKREFKNELERIMSDIVWNFVGILDTEKKLHPIPKNIQIQALFEYLAIKRLKKFAKRVGSNLIEAENTRQYPDATLKGGKINKRVAVDIKTTRRKSQELVSGFTIGSYAGYFRHPHKKMPGCRMPYGDFDEHWIIGFIYTWNETGDTLHMVSDVDLVVQEKWKIASKTTGTGTTTAIGSIKGMRRVKQGKGDFRSEEEFLEYWRSYKIRKKK